MSGAAGRTSPEAERDMARACHELRGALAALRLAVSLGRRTGGLGPEQMGAIDLEVERAAVALDDFERGGRAALRAGPEPRETVELVSLIADVLASVRPEARAAGVALGVRPGPPIVVPGDRRRLGQALRNIIANAVEHGGGAVTVGWRCANGLLRISVDDRGPGLPDPVELLLDSGQERPGRRGHGLHIAADVARGHGGRLTSAPSPGAGARVVMELPLRQATPALRSAPALG